MHRCYFYFFFFLLASPFPPSFIVIYSLSMSSLKCKALCIVIILFLLWYVCLSYSLVYFKNGPKYLTRETAQVFKSLIKFLLKSLVSKRFFVRLRYSFVIFFSVIFVGIRFRYSQVHVCLLFSERSDFFLI